MTTDKEPLELAANSEALQLMVKYGLEMYRGLRQLPRRIYRSVLPTTHIRTAQVVHRIPQRPPQPHRSHAPRNWPSGC